MARTVVYLRFDRDREGVQDPPLVSWNAEKERELWTMLKSTSTELEWHRLAKRFGVPIVYILQQAAWLYEKELGLLRRQMSRITVNQPQIGNLPEASLNVGPQVPPMFASRAEFTSGSHQIHSASSADTDLLSFRNMHAVRETPSIREMRSFHDLKGQREGISEFGEFMQTPIGETNHRLEPVGNDHSAHADDGDLYDSFDEELPSRRLLTSSRVMHDDEESDFSDVDGFVIHDHQEYLSDSNSGISQSAMEDALMAQPESDSDA